MAHANNTLIAALRKTAERLRHGAPYAWGHHGQCNCGNLAQSLTPLSAAEIQRYAHTGTGEWSEMAQDFCTTSGAPVDWLVQSLLDAGLTPGDIHHLEYLSDKKVLQNLPDGFRWLQRNNREDAIAYFEAFADLLEQQLLDKAVTVALKDLAAPVLAS